MAIVLVEVNRKAQQQRGCNCNQQQQQSSATDTASAQRVMQQAAAMPAATPDPGKPTEAAVPRSYLTAFLLMAAFGGVYLISQYNNKK